MKKKLIVVITIIILLIIPIILLNNNTDTIPKEIKKEKIKKNKKSYKNNNDNINELIKEEVKEVEKEKIVIETKIEYKEKFSYNTSNYDNISFLMTDDYIEEIKYNYVFENKIKKIIDISSWQGDIDFEKVKNEVDGVIIRLGYGTTLIDSPVLDSKFYEYINELNRLDLLYGIYFYGYAQNIFASNLEVGFVNDVLSSLNISKDIYIFYDAEINTYNDVFYSMSIYEPVVKNFIMVLNGLGYPNVGLYSNYYMLTSGSLSFNHDYPIWVAEYNDTCDYEKEYVGWQFTSKGIISGINGYVDVNLFYN